MGDGWLGILFVIAVVGISLISKLLQRKGEGDLPGPAVPPDDQEEIPEILRRMLYGGPPVRRARPAPPKDTGPPTGQPPAARPTADPRRPYHPPVAQPRPRPPLVRPPAAPPRQVVVQRAAPPMPPRPVEEEGPARRPADQKPFVVRPAAVPLARPQQLLDQWRQQRRAAQQPAVQQKAPAPVPPPPPEAAPAHILFTGLHDVRRAVILSEILATPLGLKF